MCAIDITAEQRKTVLALLARHLPNTTAWVYGSRVKWTSRPESDLDLVVFAKPEQERRVFDLREAFEESNLPFRVDLFVWDDVPEQFRKTIEAEHVVLVEREERGVGGDTATLRSLLIHTRDGEWGSANPGAGLVPIRVIRGTDFERVRRGDLTTVPIRYLRAEKSARKALKPGDILIETAGGSKGRPTGRTLLIQSRTLEGTEVPFTCASFARFLRVDEAQVNARYLYWFLQHLYQIGEMERHQVQHTGIARFQFTRFSEEIQVPLPPLPEQRHIAHILGMLDDKIELNRRMNQTLEEIARALFKSWFVDFDPVHAKATLKSHDTPPPQGGSDWTVERARAYLDRMDPNIAALFPDRFVDSELGPIPEGWKVSTIGEEVSVVGGSTPSTKDPSLWGGTIDWATPKDLSELPAPVLIETARQISETGLSKISSGLLPRGSVLLSSRAPIGYLAITEIPVAVNQGFIAMQCASRLSNVFVWLWTWANIDTIEPFAKFAVEHDILLANVMFRL